MKKFDVISVDTGKVLNAVNNALAPTYVVHTEAEANVLRSFNKMLIKAGKAPVKIQLRPAVYVDKNIFSSAYNFFHKLILG